MKYTYTAPSADLVNSSLSDSLCWESYTESSNSTCALGRSEYNNVVLDIAKAVHVLIAGAAGSGKSVLMHDIICSLMFKNTPNTARFLMIDPKMVEFSFYEGSPMLWRPVVTETEDALKALEDACVEMDRRYSVLRQMHLRNIEGTNIPRLYIVIDELADLMYTSKKRAEASIVRLAQKGRAAGIHLIIATQHPVVKVVTGIIKANITCRIALHTATGSDSRVILDHYGAELLRGAGDAIIKYPDRIEEIRFQAGYISDAEIESIAQWSRDQLPRRNRGILGWLFG